ncbi:MAG: tRNA (N(6)-L-threonylcarbamoyladenosine(37)-C(2))-methylthiotransferase MtaB, partial [Clostridiales bacterium]|nr:tRNA (N(6)-L-threonylcarbamoyladenosine(37)-C(2))-methylthiotransferase MtaB [Clostridiales bacterium]
MLFHIETLGCKVNQFESAALETLLRERGHMPATRGGACDAIVVNSCAVTGDASRQSRQTARQLQREYPGALLAVCGCASQIAPGEMEALGAS